MKTMKMLLAMASLLFIPLPVQAQAFTTVRQAKGNTTLVFNAVTVNTTSAVFDVTGYAGAVLFLSFGQACGATAYVQFSTAATATGVGFVPSDDNTLFFNTVSAPNTYYVNHLLGFARFDAFPVGALCAITAYVTPTAFTERTEVTGGKRTGELVFSGRYKPVLIGGTDYTNLVRGIKVDTNSGGVIVSGPAVEGAAITSGGPVYIAGSDYSVACAGNACTRVPKIDSSGSVYVTAASGGGFGVDETKELGIPSTVSLAANTSGTICGLTVSRMYEIQCGAAAAFRSGAATPTALTTDNQLPALTAKDITLGAASTCFAFISASATTCYASLHAP